MYKKAHGSRIRLIAVGGSRSIWPRIPYDTSGGNGPREIRFPRPVPKWPRNHHAVPISAIYNNKTRACARPRAHVQLQPGEMRAELARDRASPPGSNQATGHPARRPLIRTALASAPVRGAACIDIRRPRSCDEKGRKARGLGNPPINMRRPVLWSWPKRIQLAK